MIIVTLVKSKVIGNLKKNIPERMLIRPASHYSIFGFQVFSGGYKMEVLARNGLT